MPEPHLLGAALGCGLLLSLILDVQVSDLIDELDATLAHRSLVSFSAERFRLDADVVFDELLALASSSWM